MDDRRPLSSLITMSPQDEPLGQWNFYQAVAHGTSALEFQDYIVLVEVLRWIHVAYM